MNWTPHNIFKEMTKAPPWSGSALRKTPSWGTSPRQSARVLVCMKQTEQCTAPFTLQAVRPGCIPVRRDSQLAAVPEIITIPEDSCRGTRPSTVSTSVSEIRCFCITYPSKSLLEQSFVG
jgi:hypothetical protein